MGGFAFSEDLHFKVLLGDETTWSNEKMGLAVALDTTAGFTGTEKGNLNTEQYSSILLENRNI